MIERSTILGPVSTLRRGLLATLLALTALFSLGGLAHAEDVVDPARIQQAGNYTIEFVAPLLGANHAAETDLPFRFRVTDRQGQPVSNLRLNLTAIRDYSGQVKKEHNGPRTPNIGPLALTPVATTPGEYQTSVRFGFNGHWFIQLDGSDLSDKVKFRLPIGVAEGKGAGINFDWLVWVGVASVVAGIVVVIGRKGEVFPTPVDELQPPVPASPVTTDQATASDRLVTTGLDKK